MSEKRAVTIRFRREKENIIVEARTPLKEWEAVAIEPIDSKNPKRIEADYVKQFEAFGFIVTVVEGGR